MPTEAEIKLFLTSISQGVQYNNRCSMWCGCLELYPGEERAASPEGFM